MTHGSGVDGTDYVVDLSKLRTYSFEMGAIRPPSEGGSFSLLLRVTRNCPWSRCAFCYGRPYNHEKFSLRPVAEVKGEIDSVKAIVDELKELSWKLGFGGRLEPLAATLRDNLLPRESAGGLTEEQYASFQSIVNVYNWLCVGGKTVFLQDADTPIMPTDQLVEVIRYLREVFPGIERITSYARSKTISRKKPEELSQLRRAGLARLHVGMESGDDEVLKYIDKGVTAEEQVRAGKKAVEAGFELSEYVMPGLGGRKMLRQHAENTARVLNEINPHFVRMRPLCPGKNTPIFEACQRGEFELTSPHERLMEIGLMIKNLEVTSRVCFDHNYNTLYRSGNGLVPLMSQDYNGYKFPEEKEAVLELINKGLQMDESLFYDVREGAGILGL